MPAKKTTAEFIQEAKKVHFDKYDYSLVNYINNKTKVKIICPKHGMFYQIPKDHLRGCGCKLCGTENSIQCKPKTREQFISDAKKIHNDFYDYSETIYINDKTKVKIICPIHGEFLQKANGHLNGKGCKLCAIENNANSKRKSLQEFIQEAKKIHFDKYDYSEAIYINNQTKIKIICPKHGMFYQCAGHHLTGNGCPYCRESRGELEIANYLTKNNISFEREKRFPDCKYKKTLPFDFYLPKNNILIEFDGAQHFQPINRFGGIESFQLVQKRDAIKTKFCQDNNIKLVRIKYTDKVEKILEENLF